MARREAYASGKAQAARNRARATEDAKGLIGDERSGLIGEVALAEGGAYDNAGYTLFQEPSEEEEPGEAPLIVAETRVDVPDASVSDAVMMLDLRNTNALLFRNSVTGAHNMVYRRGDGTIGWVEPNRAQA